MRALTILLFFSIVYSTETFGQDSTLYYNVNILGAASTQDVPFWLHVNQNGSIPRDGSFGSAQLSFYKKYNPNNPRFFQWSGGAEAILNLGKKKDAFFTDLFVAAKAGPIELSVGQRKDQIGLCDSLLSTGSFATSYNYRPYPKIKISTPGFVNIIPFNDIIAFNFTYSDGMLGSARVAFGPNPKVDQTYFHQKAFYLRIGGSSHKLNLFAGFNHQAMWGGDDKMFNGLPNNEAYGYVVFGKPWASSRVGNHFGTVDVAAQWNSKRWNLFLYRQTPYEDGSLANLSNIQDGLNGIRLKRYPSKADYSGFFIRTLLLEYVYTKNQGGNVFDFSTGVFGNDDYYNHYVYTQGWSYRGRGFGNSIISPRTWNREEVPGRYTNFTSSNRLTAIHLGAEVLYKQYTLTLKGTFVNHFGTYYNPFTSTIKQSMLFAKLERPISIWNKSLLSISLAADFGKLYRQNSAVMIGWRKNGFLGK